MVGTVETRAGVRDVSRTTCCVVGGGPGGAVLARRGVDVTLLEAHPDFDREFRGIRCTPRSWRSWTSSGSQRGCSSCATARSAA